MLFEAKSNPRRGAPLRPGRRVRVQVDVIPGSGTSVPGVAQVVPQGVHDCIIHSLDVDQMMAHVEDRWDEWERAQQIHARKLEEYVEYSTRGMSRNDVDALNRAKEEAAREYRLTSEGNPEYEFAQLMRRGLRKYRSVKVLEDVEPEEDERASIVRDTVSSVVSAMGAQSQSAEVAALRRELAELKAALGETRKK